MKSLILLTLILLSSCSHQMVYLEGDLTAEPTMERTDHFFLGGVGQEKVVNATKVCKENGKRSLTRVESRQTFGNAILSVLSFGIYFPRTIRVYCR
jgi:hypothetical protein